MVANTDWLLCNKNYAFSPKRYSLGLASISRACALTFLSPYQTSTFPTVTCTNSRQKATGNLPGELLHWFINEPTTTKQKVPAASRLYMDGLKKTSVFTFMAHLHWLSRESSRECLVFLLSICPNSSRLTVYTDLWMDLQFLANSHIKNVKFFLFMSAP